MVDVAVPAVVDAIVRRGVLAAVFTLFTIERIDEADDVPMPTRPVFKTEKRVVVAVCVDEAMRKRLVFVSPLFALTESFPKGVVVPMPRFAPVKLNGRATPYPRACEAKVIVDEVAVIESRS